MELISIVPYTEDPTCFASLLWASGTVCIKMSSCTKATKHNIILKVRAYLRPFQMKDGFLSQQQYIYFPRFPLQELLFFLVHNYEVRLTQSYLQELTRWLLALLLYLTNQLTEASYFLQEPGDKILLFFHNLLFHHSHQGQQDLFLFLQKLVQFFKFICDLLPLSLYMIL